MELGRFERMCGFGWLEIVGDEAFGEGGKTGGSGRRERRRIKMLINCVHSGGHGSGYVLAG